MKQTPRLDRCYGRFNANQRVRLVIAALARGDEQETARLWENAPRERYRGCEVAFTRVLDLADEFAMAFAAAELGPRYAALEVLFQTQHLIDDLSPVEGPLPTDAEARIPISEEPIDVLYALLEQSAESLIADGARQAHGFNSFCEHELELEGSDMIAAFARPFVRAYKVFVAFNADPVRVTEVSEGYRSVWRLGLQPGR